MPSSSLTKYKKQLDSLIDVCAAVVKHGVTNKKFGEVVRQKIDFLETCLRCELIFPVYLLQTTFRLDVSETVGATGQWSDGTLSS